MSQRPSRFSSRTRRWFVCCLLFVALPVCCVSTLLSALLGPVHFHQMPQLAGVASADNPMSNWQDFRRVNHVADSVTRVHDHTRLGRHRHDAADPSLVVVGAGDHEDAADGALSAAGVAIVLIDALEVSLSVPLPSAITLARSPSGDCRFDSCDLRRLDRPPIA